MKKSFILLMLAMLAMLTACAAAPQPQQSATTADAAQVTLASAQRDVHSTWGTDISAAFIVELDITNLSGAPIGPMDETLRAELIINGAAYEPDTLVITSADGAAMHPMQGHMLNAGQTERIMVRFLIQPRKLLIAPAEVRITLGSDVFLLPLPDAE